MKQRKPLRRKSALKRGGPIGISTVAGGRTSALRYADKMFSMWVRMRNADESGHVRCFICGVRIHFEDAVAMHCEPRICMSTRYSEVNVQPGCAACNGKPLGDRDRFRKAIDAAFGPNSSERNIIKSKTMEKMGSDYLRFIGDTYARRIAWIVQHAK